MMDDPISKFILLDKFRRELMYWKLDTLGLQFLDPLRNEVEEKHQRMIAEDKARREKQITPANEGNDHGRKDP